MEGMDAELVALLGPARLFGVELDMAIAVIIELAERSGQIGRGRLERLGGLGAHPLGQKIEGKFLPFGLGGLRLLGSGLLREKAPQSGGAQKEACGKGAQNETARRRKFFSCNNLHELLILGATAPDGRAPKCLVITTPEKG